MDFLISLIFLLIVVGIFIWACKTIIVGFLMLFKRDQNQHIDARSVHIYKDDFYGQIPNLDDQRKKRDIVENE